MSDDSRPRMICRQRKGLALLVTACAAWLVVLAASVQTQASFPGQNGKIAFTLEWDAEYGDQIGAVNDDGTGYELLTAAPGANARPAWSPDGKTLALSRAVDGIAGKRVYVMNVETLEATAVDTGLAVDDPAWDSMSAWSPDGLKLAFMSDRDGNNEIYTVGVDGSDLTRITDNSNADLYPEWSPDGTQIAFRGKRGGDEDIIVTAADGTGGGANITEDSTAYEGDPSWSPDGTRIAFATDRDGDVEVYTMNVDGSGLINVTQNPGSQDESPSWSPDGTKVAFSGDAAGTEDIYVMSIDGTGDPSPVADDPSLDEIWPSWQPVVAAESPPIDDPGAGTDPTSDPAPTDSCANDACAATADATAPSLTSLQTNRKSARSANIRKKPKSALYFKYKLSEDAKVKIKLYRKAKKQKKGKPIKYVSLGSRTLSAKLGTNKMKLTTKLAKKLRSVATYKATAQATDSADNKSKSKSVTFRVVRG